jgi:hypothetical protein
VLTGPFENFVVEIQFRNSTAAVAAWCGSHLVVRPEQDDLIVTFLSHRHEATLRRGDPPSTLIRCSGYRHRPTSQRAVRAITVTPVPVSLQVWAAVAESPDWSFYWT